MKMVWLVLLVVIKIMGNDIDDKLVTNDKKYTNKYIDMSMGYIMSDSNGTNIIKEIIYNIDIYNKQYDTVGMIHSRVVGDDIQIDVIKGDKFMFILFYSIYTLKDNRYLLIHMAIEDYE